MDIGEVRREMAFTELRILLRQEANLMRDIRYAVARYRALGGTWQMLADHLGVTRQAVAKRFSLK